MTSTFNPYNPTVKLLTGELGKIERDMAKYLFKKYLIPANTFETREQIRTRREIFLQELFPTRPETIEQSDELTMELDNIQQATAEYARCPDDYPTGRTQWGYPDSLRCNHISYTRHRFTRCACKIKPLSNTGGSAVLLDQLFCAKHQRPQRFYDYARFYWKRNHLFGRCRF
jgi:hypothetical protein